MATNKSIRSLSRAGFRAFATGGANATVKIANGTTIVDIDDRQTQIILAAEKDNYVRVKDAGTFTVTIATPAVFSFTTHGFVAGDIVQFSTTGALPTGLTAGTNYYVIATGLTANAFRVAATFGGAAINTSGTQSGTHTATCVSASIVGLTRYGFRIPTTDGANTWVKLGNLNIALVDLTSGEVRRILRRTYGEWIPSTSVSSVDIRGISDSQLGFHVYKPTTATATLTSNNTNVSNADTVASGGKTYTFKTNLTEVAASATLTSDTVIPTAAETVTIDSVTYTFRAAPTTVANEVKLGVSAATALTNLKAAINQTGVSGTDYGSGTVLHPTVAGSTLTATTLLLVAKAVGTAGNAFASTETSAHLSFGGATFAGGVNAVANEIKIGGTADASLTSLSEAINAGANVGTDYATGTTANAVVTASTVAAHAITLTTVATGDVANAATLAKSAATLTVTPFTGGADGATVVKRAASVTGIDPRTTANYKALRRQFKHYIVL